MRAGPRLLRDEVSIDNHFSALRRRGFAFVDVMDIYISQSQMPAEVTTTTLLRRQQIY